MCSPFERHRVLDDAGREVAAGVAYWGCKESTFRRQ